MRTSSMANLEAPENTVSRGLSNFLDDSLLRMLQKISGTRYCVQVGVLG
ncbi:MAG: hypothetical protein HN667_10135 [Chloroflexi bacterium]|nr:hypothetical protein [Chloroflexota bacterium]MBT4943811.1 hypothetical protein [Chloroflexota bacterium]MBT5254109.1 hypothetical protein [Chloroflexota bacterium]MBT5892355.1 hypothetical protein [Chloroflexota bacterium]MBT6708255.1 hypothetical protein [Chloroflexota bacterium]